jgi:hypothetical protein
MNMLTNEIWSYKTVEELTGSLPFFDWAGGPFKPGIYNIINNADKTLRVVLFNQEFDVLVGQEWSFTAHDEIGAHSAPGTGAGTWFNPDASRILQSVWDGGASIWDGGQSIWDAATP